MTKEHKHHISLRMLTWVALIIAALALVFAIVLNFGRIFVPRLNNQKAYFEDWLTKAIGAPVKIGHIDGSVNWFDPTLKFDDVIIENTQTHAPIIHVDQVQVAVDFFYSVFKWQLLPGRLSVIGTKLNMYQDKSGQIQVQGISSQQQTGSTDLKSLLTWMVTQTDITLSQVNLIWHDPSGTVIPVENLKLRLRNRSEHRLQALIRLGQKTPSVIRINANFSQIDFDQMRFDGKAYVSLKNIVLKQWADLAIAKPLLPQLKLHAGQLNGQLWGYFSNDHLAKMQSLLNFKDMNMQWRSVKKELKMPKLDTNAIWLRQENGWLLTVEQKNAKLNKFQLSKNSFQLQYNQNASAKYKFQLSHMPLTQLAQISKSLMIWPNKYSDLYNELKPTAKLYDLTVDSSKKMAVDFVDLSVQATKKYPAIARMNGRIAGDTNSGELFFASENSQFTAPLAFRHAVPYRRLQGHAAWLKTGPAWELLVDRLHFFDDQANIQGRLNLFYQQGQIPIIDLLAGFSLANGKYVANYMPDHKIKPKVMHWLQKAFTTGHTNNGVILLRGPLKHFPYRHHQGRFQVLFDVKQSDLFFHSGWPKLTKVNANVDFDNSSMFVQSDHAETLATTLTHVTASIPDLKHSILYLQGKTQSTLNQGLNYLAQTPLNIGQQLKILQANGPMQLNLNIVLPIDHDVKRSLKLQGNMTTSKASLNMPDWNIVMQNLSGKINFSQDALMAKGLTATLFNKPVTANITTYKPGDKINSYFNIDIQGRITSNDIQQQLKIPEYKYLKGETNYQALLRLYVDDKKSNELSFLTDLRGMSVSLPQPLNKSADQVLPSNISISLLKNSALAVNMRYGKIFSAALAVDKQKQGMHITSGELHFGVGSAVQQKQPGLLITGRVKSFRWSDWSSLLNQFGSSSATKQKPVPLRLVHLFFDELYFRQFKVDKIDLRMQLSKYGYNFDIDSPNIAGDIRFPKDTDKYGITIKLTKLYLPDVKTAKNKTLDTALKLKPQSIPSVDFRVDTLRWGRRDIGLIEFRSHRVSSGMTIDKILVGNRAYAINANGIWHDIKGVQNTRLSGSFASGNYGAVLSGWQITKMLAEGHGNINFKLYWDDSLLRFDSKRLGGSVDLNIHGGRILNLGKKAESEIGLGKLLSLLSLQELPRRLTLNFSDVTKKGFSFDVMKGDFSINHGTARTTNLYLNGPIAKVLLKGDIGFGDKKLALTLDVRPYLTSTLPLVATVAGGPIAGAVTWIANKIVGPVVGRAAHIVMRVTGTFDKPQVIKLSETKGKRPKYHRR